MTPALIDSRQRLGVYFQVESLVMNVVDHVVCVLEGTLTEKDGARGSKVGHSAETARGLGDHVVKNLDVVLAKVVTCLPAEKVIPRDSVAISIASCLACSTIQKALVWNACPRSTPTDLESSLERYTMLFLRIQSVRCS